MLDLAKTCYFRIQYLRIIGASLVFNRTERLVCRQLANGFNVAEIADHLELAVSSIGRHIRSAVKKAGLANRYQLIVYIFQNPRALLKGGRCPPGLHNSETCDCPCCRYSRQADTPIPQNVPSARQMIDSLRVRQQDWKDLPPASPAGVNAG